MEQIIHVQFDSQEEAFNGQQKLNELDENGDISLAEIYIVSKDEKGMATVKSKEVEGLEYTLDGALIGGLLGVLGGPLGLLFGASAGALVGSTGDLIKNDQTLNYLEEVKKNLPKGKTVLIAHLFEDWKTPIDASLKPLGAEIHRLNFDEQVDQAIQFELDEIDKEIAGAEKSLNDAADEAKESIARDIKSLKKSEPPFPKKSAKSSVSADAVSKVDRQTKIEVGGMEDRYAGKSRPC